jgi:hypothetical protein
VPPLRRSRRLRWLALRLRRLIQSAVRRDALTLPERDARPRPVWQAPCLAAPAGWPDRAVLQAPSREDLQVRRVRKVLQALFRVGLRAQQDRRAPQERSPADLPAQPDPRALQEQSPAVQAGPPDPVAQPVAYPAWVAPASQRPSSRFGYGS